MTSNAKTPDLLPATAVEGETDAAKEARQKAIRDSYSAASKRLREAHLKEFNDLHREEAANRGYDWSPQPTKAEKAEAELRRLLEENPELAAKVPSLVPNVDEG